MSSISAERSVQGHQPADSPDPEFVKNVTDRIARIAYPVMSDNRTWPEASYNEYVQFLEEREIRVCLYELYDTLDTASLLRKGDTEEERETIWQILNNDPNDNNPLVAMATIPNDIREKYNYPKPYAVVTQNSFQRFLQIEALEMTSGFIRRFYNTGDRELIQTVLQGDGRKSRLAYYLREDPAPQINGEGPFDYSVQKDRMIRAVYTLLGKVTGENYSYPSVGADILLYLSDDPELQEIISAQLHNPQYRNDILKIFDNIASDQRYHEYDGGTVVRNPDLLSITLDENHLVKSALQSALSSSSEHYDSLALLLQKEKKPILNTESERIRLQLLELLDELEVSYPRLGREGQHSLSKAALLAIKYGNTTPLSVVKAALGEFEMYSDSNGGTPHIIRAILWSALKENPSLFGSYAKYLEKFLSTFYKEQAEERKHRNSEARTIPVAEVEKRLRAGGPIVFAEGNQALGDTLLCSFSVAEFARLASDLGSKSPIHFVIKRELAPMLRAMLTDYPNIQVSHIGGPSESYEDFLQGKLIHNGAPGILLSYSASHDFSSKLAAAGILHHRIGWYGKEDANILEHRQQQVRALLGKTLSQEQNQEVIAQMRGRMAEYMSAYIASHPLLQEKIHNLLKTKGFENGYIGIIGQGSWQTKWITPQISRTIASVLAPLCQRNNLGVAFFHTSPYKRADETDINSYRDQKIPTAFVEAQPHDPLEDSIALLSFAQGIIAPDTFLIHALNVLHALQPKVVIAGEANVEYWKIPGSNVIPALHPIAEEGMHEGNPFAIQESYYLANNFFFPFDLSQVDDPNFPELFALMQRRFRRKISEGISILEKSLKP